MPNYTLEVCVDTVEAALAAVQGGATRLELCANLVIGGTTPSRFLFTEIRRQTSIPMRVMIRPRFGDFLYSDSEFAIMKQEIVDFRELGAEGVVFGILKPDGTLDRSRMEELYASAGNMQTTLHRAFDMAKDPFSALQVAKEIGFDTILTSGQQQNCLLGKELLGQLQQQKGSLEILVGAGVTAEAAEEILAETGIRSYHLSGRVPIPSAMQYRKENVSMGLGSLSEYTLWKCDVEKVAAVRALLESSS